MALPEGVWLLTEEGIRGLDGTPMGDIPFGPVPVVAGDARAGEVGVLVDEREVWIRTTRGWAKAASADRDAYCLLRTADGRWLAGTAGARVAWVEDGGLTFLPSFDEVPERRHWDTPYGAPPELRSLALASDGTIYANVHVGWVVRSRNNGTTWESVRKGLDRDVHQVAAHPTDAGTVFAATANGFHISHDHGDSFTRRPAGMPYRYQRAVACFPDRDVYLASTAMHDGGEGAMLFRSEDEGAQWERVAGLPDPLDSNINTFQIAALAGGRATVAVHDTDLYVSEDYGATWTRAVMDLPPVHAILAGV